jgi:hypothetical protein
MSLNNETVAFRDRMIREIQQLLRLLEKVGIDCSLLNGGLQRASSDLGNNEVNARVVNSWGYDSKEIVFSVNPAPNGVKPAVDRMQIILRINVVGSYVKRPEGVAVNMLECNVIVKGYKGDDEYISTYHFDRNIEGGMAPEYPHPYYHMHFGGREMDVDNRNFGNLLLLDSPRVAHLPMEIILGVDFILSNFLPDKWNALRNDGEYVNLHRRYQKLFWRPYIHALAQHWQDEYEGGCEISSTELLPQLVPCES